MRFTTSLLVAAITANKFSTAIEVNHKGGKGGKGGRQVGFNRPNTRLGHHWFSDSGSGSDSDSDDRWNWWSESDVEALPNDLCVNPDTVTMSGFGEGGHFAHKMQIVHSSVVKGAGIMHGYPYIKYAEDYQEFEDDEFTAQDLADKIQQTIIDNATAGVIDDVLNLNMTAAYIIGGMRDDKVPLKFQEAISLALTFLNTGNPNIEYEELNTRHYYTFGKPAEIVEYLLSKLGVTEFEDNVWNTWDYGESMKFDQEELVNSMTGLGVDFEDTEMKDWGKIYVPDDCAEEGAMCHVHFAFHDDNEKSLESKRSQYNNFAAKNNVIMVYPRTDAIWDNYGEIDEDNYMNRDGVYPQIVKAMIERLGEGCPVVVPEPVVPCLDDTQKEALKTGITAYGLSLRGHFTDAQSLPWTENYLLATADDLLDICPGLESSDYDKLYCLIGLDTYQGILVNDTLVAATIDTTISETYDSAVLGLGLVDFGQKAYTAKFAVTEQLEQLWNDACGINIIELCDPITDPTEKSNCLLGVDMYSRYLSLVAINGADVVEVTQDFDDHLKATNQDDCPAFTTFAQTTCTCNFSPPGSVLATPNLLCPAACDLADDVVRDPIGGCKCITIAENESLLEHGLGATCGAEETTPGIDIPVTPVVPPVHPLLPIVTAQKSQPLAVSIQADSD